MTSNDITAALRQVTDGQAFITLSQLARAMGRSNLTKVKNDYLRGLEAVDGKYYLVREVSARLKQCCKMQPRR